jgi:hypothetical protein
LYTQFLIRGYEILCETKGTLKLASSSIPENIILDPRASCFSIALRYTTLAVVEIYLPGINSESVTSAILGSCEGSGSVFGSG